MSNNGLLAQDRVGSSSDGADGPVKEVAPRAMSLADAASAFSVSVNDLILVLLRQGVACNKNKVLPRELVIKLADHYGVAVGGAAKQSAGAEKSIAISDGKQARPPVVVVMGHIDHGKTSLLDFLRKSRVVSREKGGITQHVGAYSVETDHGDIVFLDTPGHEAFSRIRARGSRVADIAVLVVAADDGVMPQTVEAIKHALAMEVPIIVAINKMDKVDPARVDVVKQQLSQHNVLPEEWGGNTICVPISAKMGQGVDQLLEMIALQGEMLGLTSASEGPALGVVIEGEMKKGLGPVASVLVQRGTLSVGDYFVCGGVRGRVTVITNSEGVRLDSVSPIAPVSIAGFESVPEAGDTFEAVSTAEYKKHKPSAVGERATVGAQEGGALTVILKFDNKSSGEALAGAIEKLSKKNKDSRRVRILHAAVGSVSESDVSLAASVGAIVIGFGVRPEGGSLALAQKYGVSIKFYSVIYGLLDDVEALLQRDIKPQIVMEKVGEAVVRKVFKIKGVGTVAGCYVRGGIFVRKGEVARVCDGHEIARGKIKSLQRDKKTVKEVHSGYECAFWVDGIDDWQVDDVVHCFVEKAR